MKVYEADNFLSFNNINILKNMSEETVLIRIPTTREKLKVNFPEDPKGDFSLVFKSKVFKLQKAFLRLDSGYFKRICTSQTNIQQIKEEFNEQFFSNVMSCFYGATLHLKRSDIPKYYSIVKFLEIQTLLHLLKKDMIQHISQYELFIVMKIAHRFSEQDLFQNCLEQLERQSYDQLNYGRFDLLETQPALFKLIIKMHNRYKNSKNAGLSYVQIDQILRQYCDRQSLLEGKYHEFKFELIDKTALNSTEYKEIFLDQAIKLNKVSGFFDKQQKQQQNNSDRLFPKTSLNNFVKNKNLSQSFVSPSQKMAMTSSPNLTGFGSTTVSNELALQMQITFQKKLNKQLEQRNEYLCRQLEVMKGKTQQNRDIHLQMQRQLGFLKTELKKKQSTEKEHSEKIFQFQKIVSLLKKELEEKSQIIDRLCDQFEEIKNRKVLIQSIEQQEGAEDMTVVSQILPGYLIGEIMEPSKQQQQKPAKKPDSTIKQNESMDEIQLQQYYMPRLSFDIEPVSTPKVHFPSLISFICAEDFNKKQLQLIYRRSSKQPDVGKKSDIRQKNQLLILIQTAKNQNIGGYVSTRIPADCDDYIKDPQAFIFTLTKNHKFNIKKNQQNDAIFMSELYLISFANDLMITDNLKEQSYCIWPSSYEGNKNIKERGSLWLVGDEKQFSIKELQIYEIKEGEMDMVL